MHLDFLNSMVWHDPELCDGRAVASVRRDPSHTLRVAQGCATRPADLPVRLPLSSPQGRATQIWLNLMHLDFLNSMVWHDPKNSDGRAVA